MKKKKFPMETPVLAIYFLKSSTMLRLAKKMKYIIRVPKPDFLNKEINL